MKLHHGFFTLVCCVGLTASGLQSAAAQNVTTVKVISVEVSHNAIRNNEKGVLVKITAKQEGVVRFLGWTAAVEVLDKQDVTVRSLHAKKVIADNPEIFPMGNTLDYVLSLLRPSKNAFPGLNLPGYSILQGPNSGLYGGFSDSGMMAFLNGNISTVELFLPLKQFPFREKGTYDLKLQANIYEHHDILGQRLCSQSDPIAFVYEVK